MSRKITEFVAVPLIVLNLAFVVACDSGNDDPVTPSDTELNNVPNMEPDYIPNTEPDNVSDQSADSITVLPANQFNPNINYSSITDFRDGKIYKTVLIGTQTWMAENLNFETENSYCYNDVPSNCETYGRLYTWATAMDSAGVYSMAGAGCGHGAICNATTSVRGVCPEGWHLPTQVEWKTLLATAGGGSTAGTKLKSTSGWCYGSDDYGFSALPTGFRIANGTYFNQGSGVGFWSATNNNDSAWYVYLSCSFKSADMYKGDKYAAQSVRCLRDTPRDNQSGVPDQGDAGQESGSSTVEGAVTDFRDGKIYKTVLIGTQTWMAENLNFETENSYCYNDVPSNCETYGRLYTWAAAMDSAGVYSMAGALCGDNVSCNPITSVRGVCPEGWHLPSLAEWNALITAVKESSSFAAGTSLKSSSGWYNGFGANDFGFSALPAGSRGEESYGGQGLFAYFWSTTEYNSFYVYSLELGHNYNVAELIFNSKWLGFSVRCLKD